MCANGNSFGLNGSSAYDSGVRDPESTTKLGDQLMWGWIGVQTLGNAL